MAGRKQALGRGLDALFGDIEIKVPTVRDPVSVDDIMNPGKNADIPSENVIQYIDIDEIKPNSMQPRQSFNPELIDELASSIEAYGVIQPIILRNAGVGYELIAGERRWRAARKAGLKTVPALIREVTNEENALIAIIENMQREDLNTMEEATAFRTIIDKYGMTQEELAKAIGKSRPHIANTLRVLVMPEEIRDLLRSGALTLGHANALGAVSDEEQQILLAAKITRDGLSVREAERLASVLSEKKSRRKKVQNQKTSEIKSVEQELTSATGIRIVINGDGEKGSVELKYFDRQGLEEIIDLLRKARENVK